jgi:murein L,D-transpeptidase YafK
MTTHELKTLAPYWDAIECGDKNFEVRRDDRGFQKGDTLKLYRTERLAENGWKRNRCLERRISYILTGGQFGIEPGYVVLALSDKGGGDE